MPEQKPVPGRPFREAILVGDTLYISGKIGLDPTTRKPPAEFAQEVRLAMDHLKATLAEFGMTMNDLVKVEVFTPDVSCFDAFNEIYLSYFDGELPTRAFIGSGPLLFGARVEITAIAVAAASR